MCLWGTTQNGRQNIKQADVALFSFFCLVFFFLNICLGCWKSVFTWVIVARGRFQKLIIQNRKEHLCDLWQTRLIASATRVSAALFLSLEVTATKAFPPLMMTHKVTENRFLTHTHKKMLEYCVREGNHHTEVFSLVLLNKTADLCSVRYKPHAGTLCVFTVNTAGYSHGHTWCTQFFQFSKNASFGV